MCFGWFSVCNMLSYIQFVELDYEATYGRVYTVASVIT